MIDHMVILVGEQPIPNLISIRYYRPRYVTWVYTERTEPVVRQLSRLVDALQRNCMTDPYDITRIEADLKAAIEGRACGSVPWFNLTGGTKPMGYGAYKIAWQLRAPILYLESERAYVHYEYIFRDGDVLGLERRRVEHSVLDIDTYLRAFVGEYENGPTRHQADAAFVDAVARVLRGHVDELVTHVRLGPALEVDLICRWQNTVGIAELKSGKKARQKEGIDQLATASGREYLGTYTRRLLITDRPLGSNLDGLARARGITVVPLPSWAASAGAGLSAADAERLRRDVVAVLGRPAA